MLLFTLPTNLSPPQSGADNLLSQQASIPEASTPKSKAASRKKGRRRVGDLEPPPQVVKRAENEESPLFALESSGGNLFGEPEPEADISFEIKGKM